MIYRSKAPLRLGLAGGGTDTSPYCDLHGGCVINATIDLYAYSTIVPRNDNNTYLHSIDRGVSCKLTNNHLSSIHDSLLLHEACLQRITSDFTDKSLSFDLYTYVDAPAGSGLGTSSTLTVSILGAFKEWLKLPLGEYDLAKLAYEVERLDLGLLGGKQDQYAATFGGFNFMEFSQDGNVIVNPLNLSKETVEELSSNLLLYFTGKSRKSAEIIDSQSKNIKSNKLSSIEGMHDLKSQTFSMKEALLTGSLDNLGNILDRSWQAKKRLANDVSSNLIDQIYVEAVENGALGGKVTGAGGGGFMMFFCPEVSKYKVAKEILKYGGEVKRFEFTDKGQYSWTIK
jgi:D-glycero-alpha-D-manno-heptose-7-phosphate kinase